MTDAYIVDESERGQRNAVIAVSGSAAQTAKKAFDLLLKKGSIESFSWVNAPSGRVAYFLVWTFDADAPPLRMTPREALSFCRGARLQVFRLQPPREEE